MIHIIYIYIILLWRPTMVRHVCIMYNNTTYIYIYIHVMYYILYVRSMLGGVGGGGTSRGFISEHFVKKPINNAAATS